MMEPCVYHGCAVCLDVEGVVEFKTVHRKDNHLARQSPAPNKLKESATISSS